MMTWWLWTKLYLNIVFCHTLLRNCFLLIYQCLQAISGFNYSVLGYNQMHSPIKFTYFIFFSMFANHTILDYINCGTTILYLCLNNWWQTIRTKYRHTVAMSNTPTVVTSFWVVQADLGWQSVAIRRRTYGKINRSRSTIYNSMPIRQTAAMIY
jgi:hypothetical protein